MRGVLIGVLLLVTSFGSRVEAADSLDFHAKSVRGKEFLLEKDSSAATVVCFLGTECPLAKLYAPRLSRLAASYSDQGVQIVGIISNQQDTIADVQAYIDQQQVDFPIIHDWDGKLADQFDARRTPEVFLLDDELTVRYRGRIDDQYEPGVSRKSPDREDLRVAIDQLLSGRPITVAETKAVGCIIGRAKRGQLQPPIENDITFTKHVSRVMQKHCLECHRQGEIGPFSVEHFDDVAGWAETMMESIDEGRMPPWNADPEVGSFANAREMPEADRQILRDWIAGGYKKGDDADMPEAPDYVEGWQLVRDPDLVVPMGKRKFNVPPEGTVEYQYFVVDPGFKEDKWVVGAQIIPGERSVVHHAIAFLRPPDGVAMRGIGWLTAYVPGQRLTDSREGFARRIPAGSKIVFQMHYTPNGRPENDLTRLGLIFCDANEVTHEVITLIGIDQEFEIPPNTANFQVKDDLRWFPKDGRVLGIAPHMHYRGKSFRMLAERDGESTQLLHVPRYDFNWQHSYELTEPLALADIDRLHFVATFDNSESNPFNPDPNEWITWGDQTWEEMAVVFLEVAEPLASQTETPRIVQTTAADQAEADLRRQQRQQKIDAFVNDFFKKLDRNRDGIVQRSEFPVAIRSFSRWRWDPDGDAQTTREEVQQVAEQRF